MYPDVLRVALDSSHLLCKGLLTSEGWAAPALDRMNLVWPSDSSEYQTFDRLQLHRENERKRTPSAFANKTEKAAFQTAPALLPPDAQIKQHTRSLFLGLFLGLGFTAVHSFSFVFIFCQISS